MTLEFENPPLLSDIALNSSYNNEPDYTSLDIERLKAKKSSVVALTEKHKFASKEKAKLDREMSERYSDDYDSYEDDFDSPSPTKEPSRTHSSRQSRYIDRARARSPDNSPPRYRSKNRSTRRDSFASYRSAYATTRGPAAKGKKAASATSKISTKTTGGESSMMKRVLSANRNKVSKLYNIVEELQQEVEELKQENKSLKRVSHRQEKEIKKIEDDEASLPLLLQRHSAEMRTLKERCRRNQEKLHRKEKEAHTRDKEIQNLRGKVQRYQELSSDRKLEERASLAKKLENIEKDIAEKDKKIMDLEKTIMLKDKARQREMKDHKERYKQAKEDLKRVQEDFRSLKDRLQEKEKELDGKNIYHQRIVLQKKKNAPLAALPGISGQAEAPAITAPEIHAEPEVTPKRTNVFLTNAPSDSGSLVTDDKDSAPSFGGKTVTIENSKHLPTVTESAGAAVSDTTGSRRKEQEEWARRQEEERRRLEEEQEQRKRLEEEERRKEEERRLKEELEVRKMREEERLRKLRETEEQERRQKEEEDRKRQEEEADIRRKKDLLLARMRAIDNATDNKPNGVVPTGSTESRTKPSKLPIFLQSDKPIKKEPPKTKASTNIDDEVFSDSGRKMHSSSSRQSGYSYEFKQTVENLHHGLPAHASLEHVKSVGAKESTDELSFGSYKPTVGRRAAPKRDNKDKDDLIFGSYNPSFGSTKETTRRKSGLDFGVGKKGGTDSEQKSVIFGENITQFGGPSNKTITSKPSGGIFDELPARESSPVQGRRARFNRGPGISTFGEDLFKTDESKPSNNPLFGEKASNKDKSSYPWENKVNISDSQKDSLLPRRKRLQGAETNVRAVENALNDVEDEIEEVIL